MIYLQCCSSELRFDAAPVAEKMQPNGATELPKRGETTHGRVCGSLSLPRDSSLVTKYQANVGVVEKGDRCRYSWTRESSTPEWHIQCILYVSISYQ